MHPTFSNRFNGLHARGASGRVSFLALVSLTLVLSVAWLLWSGIYKPMLFGLGTLSVAMTVYLAVRMNFFSHTHGLPRMMLRLPGYWIWLLKEIVKSSWIVAKVVLSPSLPISPTIVTLRSEKSRELPQVILGNSITLSPGTITVDIDEHEVLVHCITQSSARDLVEGELMQRVSQLEPPK